MADPLDELDDDERETTTISFATHHTQPTTTPLHLCSIAAWYPRYAEHTFRTEIIPVSTAIADWLVQDGITLPDVDSAFPTRVRDEYDSSDEYSSDDDHRLSNPHDRHSESSASSEATPSTSPRSDASAATPRADAADAAPESELLELYAAITAAIERLGGAVIPKTQWSCPKDACWMLPNNTLRCTDASDVCLLLKSSDRVAHDIETMRALLHATSSDDDDEGSPKSTIAAIAPTATSLTAAAADARAPLADARGPPHATPGRPGAHHVIALRTYYDLKPGREFRCFVRNGELLAISQRGHDYHQHLVDNVDDYRDKITRFHETCIRPRLLLQDVTFDCYVPEGSSKVRLVDFNPWDETSTQPLLFAWDEIRDEPRRWAGAIVDGGNDDGGDDGGDDDDEEAGGTDSREPTDIAPIAPIAPTDPRDPPSLPTRTVPIRIIADPAASNAIRPSETSLYGVPYDFVDGGVTEHLADFLERQTL